ncbi:hypothetical protein [Nostoc sp.]|uniref:hypothetical protein n=1 Tax=Nostoc sp. TaxID=1180 RepID=UPI002FFA920D
MRHNSCSLNFSSDRSSILTSNGDRSLLISFSVSRHLLQRGATALDGFPVVVAWKPLQRTDFSAPLRFDSHVPFLSKVQLRGSKV